MLIKITLLVIFPVLVLLCADYSSLKTGEYRQKFLDIGDSYTLRGIAAFFVIFAHYTLRLKSMGYSLGICKPYTWLGGIGVCIFFFLSGYGVTCSTMKKGTGFWTLLLRLLKIFLPIVAVRCLFLAYENLLWKGEPEGSGFWYLIGIEDGPWFLNELMLIQIIFCLAWVIGRKNNKIRIGAFLVGLLIMSAVFYVLDFPSRWYDSNAMFAAGMILALYKEQILEFLKRHYYLKGMILGILFCASTVVYTGVKGDFIAVPLKILSGLCLNFVFVMITMRTELRSGIMEFFGKRSLYMYLTHISVWVIVAHEIQKEEILFMVSLVVSLVLTIIFYEIDNMIQRGIRKAGKRHG